MKKVVWFAVALVGLFPSRISAEIPLGAPLAINCLGGQVIDYTCNHGVDRRIFSESLQQKRDLYVYLPPGYDASKQYPLLIFLHGYMGDEASFLSQVVRPLDRAILCGCLPPMIVAAPDGTLCGRATFFDVGSFFINSCAGQFEDWVMKDVWNFVTTAYPIRPDRESHILAGVSMGGFGAYNLALKHRDRFKIVIGILPVLNIRWVDCHCRYFGNFDPCCWGWRTSNDNPCEVIGRFCHGLIKIRMADVIYPIFGRGPQAVALASHENPIEMVDRLKLQPGELEMYVGYAGKDEFNLDAHAESFLYVLQSKGIQAYVNYAPNGRHSERTALGMLPDVINWLGSKLNTK